MMKPLIKIKGPPGYLWKLRPYFRKETPSLFLGSLSGILMNTLVVLPAVLLGRAIDVILAYSNGQAGASQVAWAALAFLGGTLATQLPRLGKRWWLMTANARIRASLRGDALRGVLSWPMERIHGVSIGELMARMIGDVEVLGTGIHDFTVETWDTLLFAAAVAAAMLLYDPSLTLLALLPVPFAMLLVHATRGLIQRRTTTAREAHAALTTTLQEQLAGLRVLRLFGRTGESLRRVEEQSQLVQKANFASVMLREGLQPVYSTLMVAGVALVIAIGGQRVIAGALSVGAFVAFMDLFLRFTSRAYRIPRLFNTIQAGGVAYARLEPLLAASREPGGISPSPAPPVQHPRPPISQSTSSQAQRSLSARDFRRGPIALSVKNVSFRYPDAANPILKGVSLEIPAGSFVALTGPVGSGKSALLRVIRGLYAAEQGEVWLDGRPLEDLSAGERTARIGYLRQDPYLFSGDIGENIAFGPTEKVSPVRFEQAVRTALLEPDLQAFPSGLSTPVGELGSRVSGGQRQRIAMARTLVATSASPGLLLLDDPFSAVDLATEARLIASLRQAFGPEAPPDQRATILLSSHRLAAFPQADQVILLNQGRIQETGTHESLIAAGGAYARLFHAQVRVTRPDLPDHLAFPGEARPEHGR